MRRTKVRKTDPRKRHRRKFCRRTTQLLASPSTHPSTSLLAIYLTMFHRLMRGKIGRDPPAARPLLPCRCRFRVRSHQPPLRLRPMLPRRASTSSVDGRTRKRQERFLRLHRLHRPTMVHLRCRMPNPPPTRIRMPMLMVGRLFLPSCQHRPRT